MRSWLLLVALVAGVAEVHAQVKAVPERVDLGKLKQDVTISVEVQLINSGSLPIELIGTSADCGCTVAILKTKTLAPGEHTMLGISIQTRNYQGILHRNVRVQTSAGDVAIPVDMTVIPYEHWTLTPATVVMPPSLKDQATSAQATLQYTGKGKAEILKTECTPAWIEATAKTEDGEVFTVNLTKKTDAPAGNHSIKVILETSDPVDPRVTLNVFMPVTTSAGAPSQGDMSTPAPLVALRIVPSPIIMPTVKVGQTSTREFTVQGWRSNSAPRIEVPRGQVKLISQQAGEMGFEISFTPTRPGPSTPMMRVFDGEKLELEVPVVLRAEPVDPIK